MSLSFLLALYGGGFGLLAIAYFLLFPQQQAAHAGSGDGRLDFYTMGTGKLKDCYPYSLRVMVNEDRIPVPPPQVNLFHQQLTPPWMNLQKRGVLIAR